ncbi:MAG: DUF6515 family protein [Flavobacteriales bacterium]
MKKFLLFSILLSFSFFSCRTQVVTPTPRTNVVVVKKAPRHHKIVVVKGKKYYKWNGIYHRKTNRGFIAVKI